MIVSVNYILQQEVLDVTCTSTGSVASTVTWMKEGEHVEIDSTRILLIQNITDRVTSTYDNVLSIYDDPGVTAGNYCCIVSNIVGYDSQCINVTGKPLSFAHLTALFMSSFSANRCSCGSSSRSSGTG